MKVIDIAEVVAPLAKHKIIGIRPGEKLHEQMIEEMIVILLMNIHLTIKSYHRLTNGEKITYVSKMELKCQRDLHIAAI